MANKKQPAALRELVDDILAAKGWTQEQLAAELGATQNMISRMKMSGEWQVHYAMISKTVEIWRAM
jgi:predicted transcriptional regulator